MIIIKASSTWHKLIDAEHCGSRLTCCFWHGRGEMLSWAQICSPWHTWSGTPLGRSDTLTRAKLVFTLAFVKLRSPFGMNKPKKCSLWNEHSKLLLSWEWMQRTASSIAQVKWVLPLARLMRRPLPCHERIECSPLHDLKFHSEHSEFIFSLPFFLVFQIEDMFIPFTSDSSQHFLICLQFLRA